MPTTPTADEQLTLELINRLRADPQGEYARLTGPEADPGVASAMSYFGVTAAALRAQLGALSAAAPLAWNASLADAARGHNQAMIAADQQTHQAPGEAGLGDRATAAGYTGWSALGENVFAYADNAAYAHAGFVIDWGYDDDDFDADGQLLSDWRTRGDGIQDPAGHRVNLMSASYREIGIAYTPESDPATGVGDNLVTHDLGNRFGYKAQFLGVVIDDRDGDDFYDVGEGLGGVSIVASGAAGTFSTTSWASGGWQLEAPAGSYTITFSGGGLGAGVTRSATLGQANVKIDVERVAPAGPTAGDDVLDGGAGNDRIDALAGNDVVRGLAGNDRLAGGDGVDRLEGGAGHDALDGGAGIDTMIGGAGNDLYYVRDAGDVVAETAGEGADTVRAYVDYTLPDHIEAGVLMAPGLTLTGNGAANTLTGSKWGDTLVGAGGDDRLVGGTGHDVLVGGTGSDALTGGGGRDRFVFGAGDLGATATTADRIGDFSCVDGDKIDVSALDLTFIGGERFHGVAGELRIASAKPGVTGLQIDFDGNGVADAFLRVDGDTPVASDFLF